MGRVEIISQLLPLSEFIKDPDVGHVMRREAWEAIDSLLEQLFEIDFVESEVEGGK
jgi:hypothetical protein